MNFLQTLETEFELRRQRNPRYSLRAFARYLGTDHSTLSQILRQRRSLSPRTISKFGKQLRFDADVITDACVRQNAEKILQLARSPGFRTHSRWIATRTGIPLDAVNVALQNLLHDGELVMQSVNRWKTKHPHDA